MKYVKSEVSWSLDDAPKASIRTHVQFAGKQAKEIRQTKAYMIRGSHPTTLMVLAEDVRSLLPARSRGAVLPKNFNANLAGVMAGGVIQLHPEVWDEYVEDGYIDTDGNINKNKPVEEPVLMTEKAPEPEEETPETPAVDPEPDSNPADVNGDGKVDMKDVEEVVAAAREEEAGGADSSEGDSELADENTPEVSEATPDLADHANESVDAEVGENAGEDDSRTDPA